jgi:hypothetical protein
VRSWLLILAVAGEDDELGAANPLEEKGILKSLD